MKKSFWFSILFLALSSLSSIVGAQNLLNKLKNKASQEVNKLANPSSQPSGSQPNKNKLSSNVTRTVAVTLGNDEVFDYSENCIDLGQSTEQASFIVTKRNGNSTQCYSYKNGTRTPVPCPTGLQSNCQTALACSYSSLRELQLNEDEIKSYVKNQTESHNVQQPTVTDQQMKMMAAYMTPAQLEEVKKQMAAAQKQTANQTYSTVLASTIDFNGKSYGPFKQLTKFFLTPDGKNFYAIIGEPKDGNAYLTQSKIITSASNTILTLADNCMAMSCFAAPDNSEFAYINYEMTTQKYVVVTSSGKIFEMPTGGGPGQAWYSATDNHVIYLSQNQLFLDQQKIKTFDNNEYIKPCDLFVSSDGKGVSVIKNNTISFADGDYFEYPLKVSIVNDGGKAYYKWLALENREVVVYQKAY